MFHPFCNVNFRVSSSWPPIWYITKEETDQPSTASSNWHVILACLESSSSSNMFVDSSLFSLRIAYTHFYSFYYLKFLNYSLVSLFTIVLGATFKYLVFSMRFYLFCFFFINIVIIIEFLSTTPVLWDFWAFLCLNLDDSQRINLFNPAWTPNYFLFLTPNSCSLGFILDSDFNSRIGSV